MNCEELIEVKKTNKDRYRLRWSNKPPTNILIPMSVKLAVEELLSQGLSMKEIKRVILITCFHLLGYNKSEVCRKLGISIRSVRSYINAEGVNPKVRFPE